ncbi:MAG: DUF2442 domain-containing protein [Thermoanaerobaculia bacterium]
MLKDVVEVRPLGGYRVHLRFEDGLEGDLDLGKVIEFKGIFAPFRDEKEFAKVRLHGELGTIVWPNGADLDPDVLYSSLSGRSIELGMPASRKA